MPQTIIPTLRRAIVVNNPVVTIIEVADQGLPGPQGPIGASGGVTVQQTASTVLGGHRVVRSTGTSSVGYASSKVAGHGDDTVGLTLGAVDTGALATVQTAGAVTFNGWAWTPSLPVFVGDNGFLTQAAPAPESGDLFVQVFGHARSADTIHIAIEPPTFF